MKYKLIEVSLEEYRILGEAGVWVQYDYRFVDLRTGETRCRWMFSNIVNLPSDPVSGDSSRPAFTYTYYTRVEVEESNEVQTD